MIWGQVILLGMQLLNRLLAYGQERQWIQQGKNEAIAKEAVEILRKSGYAKKALEEASAMSDADLDQRLRDFEPGERSPDSK